MTKIVILTEFIIFLCFKSVRERGQSYLWGCKSEIIVQYLVQYLNEACTGDTE